MGGRYLVQVNSRYAKVRYQPDILVNVDTSREQLHQFKKSDFKWDLLYFKILRVVRHELEHQAQYLRLYGNKIEKYDTVANDIARKAFWDENYDSKALNFSFKTAPAVHYSTELASEVEAELKAYYLLHKKTKKSFKKVIEDALLFKLGDSAKKEIEYVLKKWEEYRKKHFKYMPSLE